MILLTNRGTDTMQTNESDVTLTGGETVEPVHEERGIPQVGRKGKVNKPLIAFLMLVAVLMVLFLIARIAIGHLAGKHHEKPVVTGDARSVPSLTQQAFAALDKPAPVPTSAVTSKPPVPFPPGNRSGQQTPEQQAAADLAARRQRSPLLEMSAAGGTPGAGSSEVAESRTASDNRYGSLGNALQATRATAVAATTLENPDLTITEGTFIDCVLETALDSEQPGMTRCVLPRNVYSTDGRVLLLPRGSRLVGQYQSGQLRQGQRRIFVVWTRVETPDGVIVHLDSPTADPLGRSGMNGRIDQHFIARFGAALLVSVVNDLTNYEIAKESRGTTLNFNTTTGEMNNLASLMAENSINIPPTLYKKQGDHIGIFVARDLYFGNVYGLRPVQRHAD